MIPNETHSRYHHGDLRNALIQAATTVLVEKGAAALSLREVAKVAGVSHAAPYRHFRDKAALLRVLAQGGFERLTEVINTAAENSPYNPEQKLIEAGVAYVRNAVQHPEITRLMFAATIEPQQDRAYLAASAASYEAPAGYYSGRYRAGQLSAAAAAATGAGRLGQYARPCHAGCCQLAGSGHG